MFAESLGEIYADPLILELESLLEEGGRRVPLVCLLSQGGDPSHQIEQLAKQREKGESIITTFDSRRSSDRRLI